MELTRTLRGVRAPRKTQAYRPSPTDSRRQPLDDDTGQT